MTAKKAIFPQSYRLALASAAFLALTNCMSSAPPAKTESVGVADALLDAAEK